MKEVDTQTSRSKRNKRSQTESDPDRAVVQTSVGCGRAVVQVETPPSEYLLLCS